MSSCVFVILEGRGSALLDTMPELLSEGRRLADKFGAELDAVVFETRTGSHGDGGHVLEMAKLTGKFGVKRLLLVSVSRSATIPVAPVDDCAEAISVLVKEYEPQVMLFGMTAWGRELSARVSARHRAEYVSDCVGWSVRPSDTGTGTEPQRSARAAGNGTSWSQLVLTRPVYRGKLYCDIVSASPLKVVTMRLGDLDVSESKTPVETEIIRLDSEMDLGVRPKRSAVRPLNVIKGDPRSLDLTEADVIVAGGKGAWPSFEPIREFADAIGASVGGSRAAVDYGWIPRNRLIGQTGKTISPKIYVACGISGAPQHTAGIRDSRMIVAINTDRHAPIFKVADIGIVADLHQVLPLLTSLVRERIGLADAIREVGG